MIGEERSHLALSSVLVQAIAAAAVGLVALPALLADSSSDLAFTGTSQVRVEHLVWLALAIISGLWLLVITVRFVPVLSDAVASTVLSLRGTERTIASRDPDVEYSVRWLAGAAYVVLVQAILRQPLVSVFGVKFGPTTVDAIVAASALSLLFVFLVWLHVSSHPIVEATARRALDSVVATTGSELVGDHSAAEAIGAVTVLAEATKATAGDRADDTVRHDSADTILAKPSTAELEDVTSIGETAGDLTVVSGTSANEPEDFDATQAADSDATQVRPAPQRSPRAPASG